MYLMTILRILFWKLQKSLSTFNSNNGANGWATYAWDKFYIVPVGDSTTAAAEFLSLDFSESIILTKCQFSVKAHGFRGYLHQMSQLPLSLTSVVSYSMYLLQEPIDKPVAPYELLSTQIEVYIDEGEKNYNPDFLENPANSDSSHIKPSFNITCQNTNYYQQFKCDDISQTPIENYRTSSTITTYYGLTVIFYHEKSLLNQGTDKPEYIFKPNVNLYFGTLAKDGDEATKYSYEFHGEVEKVNPNSYHFVNYYLLPNTENATIRYEQIKAFVPRAPSITMRSTKYRGVLQITDFQDEPNEQNIYYLYVTLENQGSGGITVHFPHYDGTGSPSITYFFFMRTVYYATDPPTNYLYLDSDDYESTTPTTKVIFQQIVTVYPRLEQVGESGIRYYGYPVVQIITKKDGYWNPTPLILEIRGINVNGATKYDNDIFFLKRERINFH